MLRAIKQQSSGLGAKIIMGLLIIAFAFWGVSGSIISSVNDSAATVNGEKISTIKYSQAIQASRNRLTSQFGDNLGSEYFESENFKRGVLNQLVDAELLKQVAEKFDYDVAPEIIKDYIEQSEGLQIDGKFSKLAYANYLAQVNKSAELLQREIMQEIKGAAVPVMVNKTAFSLNIEVENQYKLSKQTRSFDYLELSSADYLDKVEVSEQEINDHYTEFGSNYMTQEQVAVSYIELSVADLITEVQVTDEDIAEYYQSKKANLKTAEKRLASHILLPVNDNADKVKVEIEQVAARIKAGEDFAEVAKQVSQDPGSAPQGGDLGWVAKGDMVEEFDDKLFSMAAGEISEPVLTNFGYHIIKLTEVKLPAIPELDEIKDSLTEELKTEKANNKFLEVANKLDEAIVDADNVLEVAAESIGLSVKATELFARGQATGIAANPAFTQAAFSDTVIKENEISEMINLGDNHIAYLHLKEHLASAVKPLEQVSDAIKTQLQSEKAFELVNTTIANYVEAINASDSSLESVATELDKTVLKAENVARVGSKLPFNLVNNVFKLKFDNNQETKGKIQSVTSSANTVALVDLLSVTVAAVSSMSDEDKSNITAQLERSVATNETLNLLTELRKTASIKINEQVFVDAAL